jgi:hypothetical protein
MGTGGMPKPATHPSMSGTEGEGATGTAMAFGAYTFAIPERRVPAAKDRHLRPGR